MIRISDPLPGNMAIEIKRVQLKTQNNVAVDPKILDVVHKKFDSKIWGTSTALECARTRGVINYYSEKKSQHPEGVVYGTVVSP